MQKEFMQIKEPENKKSLDNCPSWKEVAIIFIISIAGFILSSWIFFISLSDIKGYIEDHNYVYSGVEYVAIFLLLITFYIAPKFVLSGYNLLFPKKKCNSSFAYYTIGILTTIMLISIISLVIFPQLVSLQGYERDALWQTILSWLVCIFFINILFNSNGFQTFAKNVVSKIREISYPNKNKISKGHSDE